MYLFIGEDVVNSIDIMVEATTVNTIDFICLERHHSNNRDIYFDRDGARVTAKFEPFCSGDFTSGDGSFLERLITHLSQILEVV